MTEITPERLAQIKARAAKATAGPWETDATKNDGNYGGGPDCGNGFSSYEVMAASGRICDTLNSDVALVCEEYDEDGRTAFDEVGQANMEFIAAARQDIPDLIAALALACLLCAGWRVIDGDTVEIGGEIVRLANIDTPETGPRALCEAERRLGNMAKARLKALMGAGAVTLVRGDPVDGRLKDRHGRTLALVYVDGAEVGAVLVSEGLARPWTGRRLPWCGKP